MLRMYGLFLFERAMAAFAQPRSVKDSAKSEKLLSRLALAEIGEFTGKTICYEPRNPTTKKLRRE